MASSPCKTFSGHTIQSFITEKDLPTLPNINMNSAIFSHPPTFTVTSTYSNTPFQFRRPAPLWKSDGCSPGLLQQIQQSSTTASGTISPAESPAFKPQSDLFQSGFQDCATEVIRFLKDQENIKCGNPLLEGLTSHLMNFSQSIGVDRVCKHSAPQQNPELVMEVPPLRSSSPINVTESTMASSKSTQLAVPETIRAVVCTSPVDCEMPRNRKRSFDSVQNLTFPSHCSDIATDGSILSPLDVDVDEPFLKPIKKSRQMDTCQGQNRITTTLPISHSESSSLHTVASQSLRMQTISTPQQLIPAKLSLSTNPPCLETKSSFIFDCSSSAQRTRSDFPSMRLLPTSTLSSSSSPSISISSASTIVVNSESIVPSLPMHLKPPIYHLPTTFDDLSQLSADSENLDDILRSVESCQSHEDPRVRSLASKIINLINDDDEDDDDEVYDDEDVDENECIRDRQELEDSGIDLEDE